MALVEEVAINVLIAAPECPSSVAEYAVVRAFRELTRRSLCWRVTLPVSLNQFSAEHFDLSSALSQPSAWVTVFGGDSTTYAPTLGDVISITRAGTSPLMLQAKTTEELDRIRPGWREETGSPIYWTRALGDPQNISASRISLVPNPRNFRFNSRRLLLNPTLGESIVRGTFPIANLNTGFSPHTFTPTQRVILTNMNSITDSGSPGSIFENLWRALNRTVYRVRSSLGDHSVQIDPLTISVLDTTHSQLINPPFEFPADINLHPQLSRVDYDITLAAIPALTARAIPDLLLSSQEETIISGALFYILNMPGTPWMDSNKAIFFKAAFEEGVRLARSVADDGYMTNITRRVRYRGI